MGWQPLQDIQSLFLGNQVLQRRYYPDSHVQFNTENLKNLVLRILDSSDTQMEETVNELMALPPAAFGKHTYIADLLPRLAAQYSKSDPGSLIAL